MDTAQPAKPSDLDAMLAAFEAKLAAFETRLAGLESRVENTNRAAAAAGGALNGEEAEALTAVDMNDCNLFLGWMAHAAMSSPEIGLESRLFMASRIRRALDADPKTRSEIAKPVAGIADLNA